MTSKPLHSISWGIPLHSWLYFTKEMRQNWSSFHQHLTKNWIRILEVHKKHLRFISKYYHFIFKWLLCKSWQRVFWRRKYRPIEVTKYALWNILMSNLEMLYSLISRVNLKGSRYTEDILPNLKMTVSDTIIVVLLTQLGSIFQIMIYS